MEALKEELKKEAVLLVHRQGAESYSAMQALAGGRYLSNLSLKDSYLGPSSPALQTLRSVSLSELKVGKVHHGCALYGTLIADAFVMTAVATVLQDEQDSSLAVRVSVYNAASSTPSARKLYPKNMRIAIKEPYLKRAADGLLAIRVENPANMEKVADGSVRKDGLTGGADGPLQLKEKGNTFFASQDWSKAIQCYGECIIKLIQEGKEKEDENLVLAAYSNRAEAHMKLGSYREALIDCEAALSINPDHVKSEYRKGRALHGLMQFQDASVCLEGLLSRHPELSEVRSFLDTMKSTVVASEMIEGLSDFVLNRKIIPKFSDFVGPVVVRQTEDGRGRGLFATARVRPGDLLMASNALAFAVQDVRKLPVYDAFGTKNITVSMQEDMVSELVRKGNESSALLRKIYSLASSTMSTSMEVPSMDMLTKNAGPGDNVDAAEVDIERIQQIVQSNGFNQEPMMYDYCCAGIWLLPSFINHSCIPNACRAHVGKGLLIHAAAEIKAGEEITMPYFNPTFPLEYRTARTKTWNFQCVCKRCQVEKLNESHLHDLNKKFSSLFEDGRKEYILAMKNNTEFRESVSLMSACKELFKLYKKIKGKVAALSLLSNTEKKWLLTSYSSAFFAQWFRDWGVVEPKLFGESFKTAVELMEALRASVPGCPWNFSFVIKLAWLVSSGICRQPKGRVASLMEQADKECTAVFGKHKPEVITQLMERDHGAIPSIFVF
ncbi:hypothetical protein L7F22_032974 [Adiantum nelumboides]|nr:hypothetical protein [Adiantum nelumboides]